MTSGEEVEDGLIRISSVVGLDIPEGLFAESLVLRPHVLTHS
jgi:hypothetical protein